MNIDKNMIMQLLQSQGHPRTAQAGQELPDQVSTEDPEHLGLLSKFGIDPDELTSKLGGLGGLGGTLGKLI